MKGQVMNIKQILSGVIISTNLFFGPLKAGADELSFAKITESRPDGDRINEPSSPTEYLIKFKTHDHGLIKTLSEKYRVEFKEAIPELGVYSSILNEDVLRQLSQEEIVSYLEPNIRAKTTYADVEGTQEIITDAPWYLAPDRWEIPVLLFVPEVYWRDTVKGVEIGSIDKARGLQLSKFIIANPPDASSEWSFEPDWKPTKNILYYDDFDNPPRINKTKLIEDEMGDLISDIEKKQGIISQDQDTKGAKPITEPGWHRILLIPRGVFKENAGDVYISTYVSHQRWFIKKPGLWDRWVNGQKEPYWEGIKAEYPTTKMLKVKVGKRENGGLPRFNPADRYYDIHNHTMSEYSTNLIEKRLAYGGPLRMVEHCAYALGMTDIIDHNNPALKNQIFSSDHNCFLKDKDIPEVGPYKEKINDPHNEYEVLKKWFGTKTGAQEVSLNTEHRVWSNWVGGAHLLVYEHPNSFEGPWHGGRPTANEDSPERTEVSDDFFRPTVNKYTLSIDQPPRHLKPLSPPKTDNNNTLKKVLSDLRNQGGTSIAAHPLHKKLYWDNSMFIRALGYPPYNEKLENVRNEQFVFKGFQGWNDPEKYRSQGFGAEFFRCLNPFYPPQTITKKKIITVEGYYLRSGVNTDAVPRKYDPDIAELSTEKWTQTRDESFEIEEKEQISYIQWQPNTIWHQELGNSLIKWQKLIKLGFDYHFKKQPEKPPFEKFIRKSYFYAGSDAHGDFNYATGVYCKTLSKIMTGDNIIYDNAYAKERTYVLGDAVENVHQGQCINTDGPLVEFMMDSDGKFDSSRLVWHDKKIVYENDNGLIGGAGDLDGGRTMLIRREGPSGKSAGRHQNETTNLMLKYRWANTADFGKKVNLIDLYQVSASTEVETETIAGVTVPKTMVQLPVYADPLEYLTKELTKEVRPLLTSIQAFWLGGFTNPDPAQKYHPADYRCFTNPIWVVPAKIEISTVDLDRLSSAPKTIPVETGDPGLKPVLTGQTETPVPTTMAQP
ncbi:MAG: hypothetical protein AAB019_01040, partial [Planctomycetota bacterium]